MMSYDKIVHNYYGKNFYINAKISINFTEITLLFTSMTGGANI